MRHDTVCVNFVNAECLSAKHAAALPNIIFSGMCLQHRHWYPHPKTWEYEQHQSRGSVPETHKTDSWFKTLVQNHQVQGSHWNIVSVIKVWLPDSLMFVDVTLWPEGSVALPQGTLDTVPRPKWTLGLWRTTFLALRHSYFWQKWKCITGATNFKISFKIWLLMHMMPYTGKVPWPSSATARGLWGNDKLAIDKGGNLPEKVENHWSRVWQFSISRF